MKPEQEKEYLEKYKKAKAAGYKFWPDIIYKDLLISFGIFILIVLIAMFIGVAAEPPADPSDAAYIPRPEWYFLFLFQMLKFIPPKLEWVGTVIIPTVAVLALILLPFYDRSPFRHWKKRKLAIGIMSLIVLGMVGLTISAAVTTPPQQETAVATTLSQQIVAGQDLYSTNCVECHGADGEGGEVKGVEGLEGRVIKTIHSADEMYTRTDETLFNIIDYGQPDLGMTPFGLAHGGKLSRGDIQSIVTFMRYSWDDRVQLPAEAAQAGAIPTLAPDQVPSYADNLQPIVKRYCISCHQQGKKNNNFLMGSYDQIMTTGDHAPNLVAGDLNSNLMLMLGRQKIEAGGPMPPTKPLPPDLVDIFKRWVMAGMPNTAQDAAAKSTSLPQATPQGPAAGTPTP